MLKPISLLFLSTSIVAVTSFTPHLAKEKWKVLFNGKDLTGWNTYLGPDLDSNGKMLSNTPVGLNNDPHHVFTIVNDGKENVIRISGEGWGAISTPEEFENYHLQLRFKWGQLSWGQKKNKKKDSGLLYHSVGKQGADYGAWMRSQEFQIEEGNCGDYWGVAGGMEDIPATRRAKDEYVFDPAAPLLTFSEKSANGRHCIKRGDAENTSGEWNTIDLYCSGDTSIHVVNGKTVMVLYHSQQLDNGQMMPLTKGSLQIQSEGAEVFYKDIKIQRLQKLPPALLY